MGRIPLGGTSESQRSWSRKVPLRARKNVKKAVKKRLLDPDRALLQRKWRKQLGRAGRALRSAIDAGRKRLAKEKRGEWPASKYVRWLNRPGESDRVAFDDPLTGKKRREPVYAYCPCNDPRIRTQGWVVVERNRKERERDRRLCRFLAVPLEDTNKVVTE